jgi:hypothetical protein
MNLNYLKFLLISCSLLFTLSACGPEPILPATNVEATFYLLPDSIPINDINVRCFSDRKEIKKTKTDKDGKLTWKYIHADSTSDLAWCLEDVFLTEDQPRFTLGSSLMAYPSGFYYSQPLFNGYSFGFKTESGTSNEVIFQTGQLPLPPIKKFNKNVYKSYLWEVADVEIEFRFSDAAAQNNIEVFVSSAEIQTAGLPTRLNSFWLSNKGGSVKLRNFPVGKATIFKFNYGLQTSTGMVSREVNLSILPDQKGVTKKYQVLID